MLVISRHTGDETYIDVPPGWSGRITLIVVAVDRGRVRLGIAAPEAVKITRDDLGKGSRSHKPIHLSSEEGAT